MTAPAQFISCDWGTSSFRLSVIRHCDLAVLEQHRQPAGIKSLTAELPATAPASQRAALFSEFLQSQLALLRTPLEPGTPVVISGMASSSAGWKELPYAKTPFPMDGSGVVHEKFEITTGRSSWTVFLLSGLATGTDIMRGEETECLGLFCQPDLTGFSAGSLLILPGTHSKHIVIRQASIASFSTYMTGELYEVLATHSLLRLSVESVPLESTAISPAHADAFQSGVRLARTTGLAAGLFQVRTRSILQHTLPSENSWLLSGILIGAELLSLQQSAAPTPILLAATPKFSRLYQLAWSALDSPHPLVLIDPAKVAKATVHGHAHFLAQQ